MPSMSLNSLITVLITDKELKMGESVGERARTKIGESSFQGI
jgi:hypothetical protein